MRLLNTALLTVLCAFACAQAAIAQRYTYSKLADIGSVPAGAPSAIDSSGNLYGTTLTGQGTIFEMDRETRQIRTLAAFDGNNGCQPFGGVVLDSSRDLFGTTGYQGKMWSGQGVVFELPQGSNSIQVVTPFDAYQSNINGYNPLCTLVADSDGNLYGTTRFGGAGETTARSSSCFAAVLR